MAGRLRGVKFAGRNALRDCFCEKDFAPRRELKISCGHGLTH